MNCPETQSENCVEHCTLVDYKSMYAISFVSDRNVYNTPHKYVKTTQKIGNTQYEK
jgi:hypothetical protein